MSATQITQQDTQTFAVERPDLNAKIFITKYGVGQTSAERLYSYDTVRYSYYIEKQRDGQTITCEYRGFRNWEDALNDAQWGIGEL